MKTTVNALAELTGFSRPAITRRRNQFKLGAEFDVKDILMLRPLGGDSSTLAAARTKLALEQAALAEARRCILEREWRPIAEFREGCLESVGILNKALEGMPEEGQERIAQSIRALADEYRPENQKAEKSV